MILTGGSILQERGHFFYRIMTEGSLFNDDNFISLEATGVIAKDISPHVKGIPLHNGFYFSPGRKPFELTSYRIIICFTVVIFLILMIFLHVIFIYVHLYVHNHFLYFYTFILYVLF